jgi:hypothetical protein
MLRGKGLTLGLGSLVILLSVYIFVSHSSSRQAIHDEIRSACESASMLNPNKRQVVLDFNDIAARDSGYLLASYGATLWAAGENPPFNFIGEGANANAQNASNAFWALCGAEINKTLGTK